MDVEPGLGKLDCRTCHPIRGHCSRTRSELWGGTLLLAPLACVGRS